MHRTGRLAVDKGVANRFIKHAIAQIKFDRPPGQDEGISSQQDVRVPVKVTEKMIARAQYEKELKELGSEEEDDLEVIDDAESQSSSSNSPPSDKGKGKAKEMKAITEAKLEIDWADGNFLFNKEERPEGEVEFVGRDARERELIRGLVLSPQKSGKNGKGRRGR